MTILNIDELAEVIGCAATTLRTWLGSYKLTSFCFYGATNKHKTSTHVKLSPKFCKVFYEYLIRKTQKGKPFIFANNFMRYCVEHQLMEIKNEKSYF